MASPPVIIPEPAPKRKRGRPRKYPRPEDDSALSAIAAGTQVATPGGEPVPGTTPVSPIDSKPPLLFPPEKRKRGRPPGSGKKSQQAPVYRDLAMTSEAKAIGQALQAAANAPGEPLGGATKTGAAFFTPRLINVAVGEDVAGKVFSYSQQEPRAICVMAANGSLSAVTLRHDTSTGASTTYEGRFEILSLSGSFLYSDVDGTRSRSGGLSVSLSGADGKVVGGSVAGLLVAASPVQIVLGSFIPDV